MKKKFKIILFIFLILGITACINKNEEELIFIKEDLVKKSKSNEEKIDLIIFNYIIAFGMSELDGSNVDFDKIFNFFYWAGCYDYNEEIREELKKYYSEKNNTLRAPSRIVDEFLTNKFSTTINHSKIKNYDNGSDMYIIEPFQGDFYYDIVNTNITEIKKDTYEIHTRLVDSFNTKKVIAKYKFTLEIKNEDYKYISIELFSEKTN